MVLAAEEPKPGDGRAIPDPGEPTPVTLPPGTGVSKPDDDRGRACPLERHESPPFACNFLQLLPNLHIPLR